MRVGVLTGGGDSPSLNAVIRAIVRRGEQEYHDELVGFLDAWQGLLEDRTIPLDVRSLRGMLPRGGTLLGTTRGSPFDLPDGPELVKDALARHDLDALIVIGGNGTLTVACWLHESLGLPIVGVPKTSDNDIIGTDITFGFNTAVQAGWIATHAGIAGGATVILVPEIPLDLDQISSVLQRRHDRGRYASIVVVAEGAEPRAGTFDLGERQYDQFGHARLGAICYRLAPEIERRTGYETRVVVLGHVQRGGTPSAFDRVLSTRYGLAAIEAVHDRAWGQMVVVRGDRLDRAPIRVTMGRTRTIDLALYHDVAEVFFG